MAPRDTVRKSLMLRARRGEFSSATEIAIVAGIARMTAHRWLVEAKIDVTAARMRYLAKVHQHTQEMVSVESGQRPLSAQARRKQVVEAVKRLNDAQTQRVAKEP